MKVMRFLCLILFLGDYSSVETSSTLTPTGHYICLTDDGILQNISATNDDISINLARMKIKSITVNAFRNVKKTVMLNLMHNELEELLPLTFSRMRHLLGLGLCCNKIHSLHRAFVGLRKLKVLDLSNNRIKALQRGDLFGLRRYVSISVTDLATLSSGVFRDPSVPVKDSKFEVGTDLMNFEDALYFEVAPLPDNFKIKMHKTDDGLLTSVEKIKPDDVRKNLTEVNIEPHTRSIMLHYLGLKKFQTNWFKLSGNIVRGLDLSFNFISDITPELLNALPSDIVIINLTSNKISMIRKNIIENRCIRTVILALNPISTIEDGAFEKTNLTSINVFNAGLKNLKFVKTLPITLRDIRLSANSITGIPVDTFRGHENLITIDLSDNHLEKIEPGTFENQKNLMRLFLSGNKFRELNSGMFRGLIMMNVLSFANNQIAEIHQDTFSEIRHSNLKQIHLTHNRIYFIEGGSFSGMNLTKIDLSWNEITQESIARDAFNGSKFRELVLDGNLMEKFNAKSFSGILGLYELSLRRNRITTFEKGNAEYLKHVRHLHLSNNPLTHLTNGALYGLAKDKDVQIYLNGSPITVIQGDIFDDA